MMRLRVFIPIALLAANTFSLRLHAQTRPATVTGVPSDEVPVDRARLDKAIKVLRESKDNLEILDACSVLDYLSDQTLQEYAEPLLAKIIDADKTDKALLIACQVAHWNDDFPAHSPEFQRLRLRVYAALTVPNAKGINDGKDLRATAILATMLLAKMGPDAIRSGFNEISSGFLAPLSLPFEPESDDGWTRFIQAEMLAACGARGGPILAKGLERHDAKLRCLTLDALARLSTYADSEFTFSLRGKLRPAEIAAARKAAHDALPAIIECLWDDDAYAVDHACRAFGSIATPADDSPRLSARLNILSKDAKKYGEVAAALAALHPVPTPALLQNYADGDVLAFNQLVAIGSPAIPAMMGLLPEPGPAPVRLPNLLMRMGARALAGLARAAQTDKNPAFRERAAAYYHAIYMPAREEVLRRTQQLEQALPSSRRGDNPEQLRITCLWAILNNAVAGEPALPVLQRLAQSGSTDKMRSMAQAAIDKIKSDALPLEPGDVRLP